MPLLAVSSWLEPLLADPFSAIDHVQLAMPAGEEERARAFYGGLPGLIEMPKPPELAARGGCWFASGDVQIHFGVDTDFRPARKAHAAAMLRTAGKSGSSSDCQSLLSG